MLITRNSLLSELEPYHFSCFDYGKRSKNHWDPYLPIDYLVFATTPPPDRTLWRWIGSPIICSISKQQEANWRTSYWYRFEPLRQTDAGKELIGYYRLYQEALKQGALSQEQKESHPKLVASLWILAHQEAGFLENPESLLTQLAEKALESSELIRLHTTAEEELAS